MFIFSTFILSAFAQTRSDSIAAKVLEQGYLNFPAMRTFSVALETNLSNDYNLKLNGAEMERGEVRNANTLRMSATLPIVQQKRFSLYVNGKADFFFSDTKDDMTQGRSKLLNEKNYNYYQAGISASYRLRLFNKPFMLNATVLGDGGNDYFGKVQYLFSATMSLKQTQNTHLSIGLGGITLFNKMPIFITFNYWHKFTDKLNMDITMPHHAYFRYRPRQKHRFSIGTSLLCDGFYLKTNAYELPENIYYNKVMINPELMYEYILSKHFLITAKMGTNLYFTNGFYKPNRKGIDGDPLIKMKSQEAVFFNIGISYNL